MLFEPPACHSEAHEKPNCRRAFADAYPRSLGSFCSVPPKVMLELFTALRFGVRRLEPLHFPAGVFALATMSLAIPRARSGPEVVWGWVKSVSYGSEIGVRSTAWRPE